MDKEGGPVDPKIDHVRVTKIIINDVAKFKIKTNFCFAKKSNLEKPQSKRQCRAEPGVGIG